MSGEVILVADDEEPVLRAVSRMLRDAGYVVLQSDSADEALALSDARAEPIDLLLSDVVLPPFNGPTLARRIRARRRRIGVVLMTGFSADDAAAMGVVEGEMPLVEKPFTAAQLLQVVRRTLDEHATGVDAGDDGDARA